jgi:hypothetical protein
MIAAMTPTTAPPGRDDAEIFLPPEHIVLVKVIWGGILIFWTLRERSVMPVVRPHRRILALPGFRVRKCVEAEEPEVRIRD